MCNIFFSIYIPDKTHTLLKLFLNNREIIHTKGTKWRYHIEIKRIRNIVVN
jgi:hypothetical protein